MCSVPLQVTVTAAALENTTHRPDTGFVYVTSVKESILIKPNYYTLKNKTKHENRLQS